MGRDVLLAREDERTSGISNSGFISGHYDSLNGWLSPNRKSGEVRRGPEKEKLAQNTEYFSK